MINMQDKLMNMELPALQIVDAMVATNLDIRLSIPAFSSKQWKASGRATILSKMKQPNRPLDKSAYWKITIFISKPKHIYI